MLTAYPTELSPELHFLNLGMNLGKRADEALMSLHEHGFVAAAGLTEFHAGSLLPLLAHSPMWLNIVLTTARASAH